MQGLFKGYLCMTVIVRVRKKRITLLGDFVRAKRQELSISQQNLGQLLVPPVTTQFMSNIERGVTPLPCHHLKALASALKVKESQLTTLLESEVKQKFMGKLGKAVSSPEPYLIDSQGKDAELLKRIYAAYQAADRITQKTFAEVSATLLKIKPLKDPSESE